MLYDSMLLRTFVAVSDLGSFTKAALHVNLTQSAISLHIKRLEEQVGSQLVLRGAHGIRLTLEGEILLSYARRILALHKEARNRLDHRLGGPIRIRAAEFVDSRLLFRSCSQFGALYPDIHLHVSLGRGPDLPSATDEEGFDLSIVSDEVGYGSGLLLYRDRRVWATSPHMSFDRGQPIPVAIPHQDHSNGNWGQPALEQLDSAGWQPEVILESSCSDALLNAVEAGIAIAIVPERLLRADHRPLTFATSLPPLPDIEFKLRRGKRQSHEVDRIAAMFLERFIATDLAA
jgi:DNA-binding transcriptional LysR family regulator